MKLHQTLSKIDIACWELLNSAIIVKGHPLRTPTITTGINNTFQSRTVVLRKVDTETRTLIFYTDIRSSKIEDLQMNSRIIWHFYDLSHQIQIRAKGKVLIHHKDDYSKSIWAVIPLYGRKDYCALQASGTVIDTPQAATPDTFLTGEPNKESTEYGYDNFAVVETVISEIDWLHLHRDGHQRAQLTWDGNQWEKHWLVP